VFALRADDDTAGETVTATGAGRRVHGDISAGARALKLVVPMENGHSGHGRFSPETPTVRWKISQVRESATTNARATLRVTNSDGRCITTYADLHLTSASHGG
jgi:hypothetical protein